MSVNGKDGHYDAVIVGSGFGGSVTAYRLAQAGKRVCVLERGRAYPPGSFTRSPYRARESFWDPPHGLTGMYHYWSFHGIDALVSAGLGGGSLIYANVFIRKDEKWFVQEDLRDGGYEHWPVTRADLDPHYDRVESMIGLQRYPFDHEPYSKTPKTIAFKAAAEANGMEWFLPKLAVTFANEGRPPVPGEAIVEELENLHGRTRTTCQLCGECDVGCNYGAKNTLDYNYLTHAAHHGAELRTLCDVRRFEPREGGGYAVHYAALEDVAPARITTAAPPPLRTLTCDHLVLSAGHAGDHQPAAAQPRRLPAAEPPPGHALLRQRRPAHAGHQHPRDGRRQAHPADRRSRLRPGHHEHGAHARRARRRRGPRLLPPGRRLSAAAGLDPARPRGAQVAVGLALDRHVPGQELAAGLARHRRERLHRRPAAVARAVGRRPAAARDGPRHPRRADVPAQRPARPRLEPQALGRVLRAPADDLARVRPRARRALRRQPDLVPAARDHGPPAGRLPDGPRRHRGRRRPLRQRLRLSRACTSPTARSCRGPSVPTRASRSPPSPTASPTAC